MLDVFLRCCDSCVFMCDCNAARIVPHCQVASSWVLEVLGASRQWRALRAVLILSAGGVLCDLVGLWGRRWRVEARVSPMRLLCDEGCA